MRACAGGVLLLLIAGVVPAAAQTAPSHTLLRATMLSTCGGVDTSTCGWEDGTQTEPSEADPLLLARSSGPPPVALPADTTLHDPWFGRDKALHAGGSFLLTLSAQYVLTSKLAASENEALPISAGATLSLGLAKEIADSRRPVRPHFSVRDLVADAVGVALAVGLILL